MGCIRVTHPCATLIPPKGHLPFDLHVLGLPLAFILSQDQTLHCILLYFYIILFLPGGFTCFLVSWNFRFLTFQTTFYWLIAFKELATSISVDCGCKSTHFFIPRNTFLKKFFNYFLCIENQQLARENFSRRDKNQSGSRLLRPDFLPLLPKFLRHYDNKR